MSNQETQPVTAQRDETIAASIREGVEMAQSALAVIRNAALQFVDGLNPTGLESAAIPAVVKQAKDLYNEDFGGDHNARAYFGDVITLALAGSLPISFEKQVTKDGKREKVDVHTTGAEATRLAKHDLRAAAKAVREELGTSRASGGGRPPQTPQTAPSQAVTVFSMVELKSLLAGLWAHSAAPDAVLNKALEEYHVAVVSAADLEAFQKWQAENTKPAKPATRARRK